MHLGCHPEPLTASCGKFNCPTFCGTLQYAVWVWLWLWLRKLIGPIMKDMVLPALAAILVTGHQAFAQGDEPSSFFLFGTSPEVIETIAIVISDDATGGCWTNLGEAKTYAEDQLRLKGYELTQEHIVIFGSWGASSWDFNILVHSERLDNGRCYGSAKIELKTFVSEEFREDRHTSGRLVIGKTGSIFTGYQNANTLVLDLIREAIDDFPRQ